MNMSAFAGWVAFVGVGTMILHDMDNITATRVAVAVFSAAFAAMVISICVAAAERRP
jgi:ABC-type nitrate/sulfonate/bicarbonate transport system permease component